MQQRLNEINLLRGIACIAVIFIHITAVPVSSPNAGVMTKIFFSFLNRSLSFAVPAFIFISGLTLFYNYQNKKLNYFLFLKKRLKYVLIPYFLWTLIYYSMLIYGGYYTFSIKFLVEKLFLADMFYHLYFVLIIIQFYLLFGLFHYLFKGFNSHFLILFFFIVNICFAKYVYFKYVDRFFLQYIFFFALGCYFAKNYLLLKKTMNRYKLWIILGYVVLSLTYTYQFYTNSLLFSILSLNLTWIIFSLIAILFYFYLSDYIEASKSQFINNFLNRVSESSYGIYLGHALMLFVGKRILSRFSISSTSLNFLIITIFVLGTVFPVAFWYKTRKIDVTNRVKTFINY